MKRGEAIEGVDMKGIAPNAMSMVNRGGSGGAEATLAEKIRDLKQLHEQGVLDDDEFKSAKAKLLG